MRRLLPPLAGALVLAGCVPGAPADVEGQPTAHHASGSRVYVETVERDGDRTFVTLTAVNATDSPMRLGRRSDPPTLLDADGVALTAAEEDVEVPAFSTDRIRLAFDGRAGGGPLTLRLNGESGSSDDNTRSPQLTVPDLPARGARFRAGALPAGGPVEGVQANHANGATVLVRAVRFEPAVVEMDVQVVNGSERELRLSPSTDEAVLLDDRGHRYPLVPPPVDAELRLGEGQTLTGTLRFAGRLAPDAQALTLHFNEAHGSTEDWASRPRVALPPIPIAR